MTVLDCLTDRHLFGRLPAFRDLSTWRAWLVWLRGVFALPIGAEDLGDIGIYQSCTGRYQPPAQEPREVFTICGRRAGKSWMSAVVAVFLACFRDYAHHLTTGERATVLVLARDREQARVVFNYIRGILREVPLLRKMVRVEKAEEIELRNPVSIMVKTSDFRSIRGVTVAAAILDEIAFWQSEGVNPDKEILAALRPAMATIPNSKLLVISTPYARAGALYETFKDHYGGESDILVWRAATTTMNPAITKDFVQQEVERDLDAARAEWLAEFREDVEAAFSVEMIESCIVPGRAELPPAGDVCYQAFADPSGGRRDAFTLAIGHRKADMAVVDLLKAWHPPFDPSVVVEECAATLKGYNVHEVTGDRYAGEWPREAFRKHEIIYSEAEKPKSDLYLSFIPVLCSNKVELPDHRRLLQELRQLERRRGRSGKDSVDHPTGGHDDLANAVAGLCHLLGTISNWDTARLIRFGKGQRTFAQDSSLWRDSPWSMRDF